MAENIIHQMKFFTDHPDWQYVYESVFTVLNIDEERYQDLVEDTSEQLTNEQ